MTLQDDSHGGTAARGERRRRREAERAAREAAEQAAPQAPLTRRELRLRALEEEARRKGLVSGDVPLGAAKSADAEASDARPAADVETSDARPTTEVIEVKPARPTADVSADSASTPSAGVASPSTSVPAARPFARVARPTSSPSAPAAGSPSAPTPVRRSVRELSRDADDARGVDVDRAATARTGTIRRPVVRAPHEARGIRSLDSTGTLTGVQPVTPLPPDQERARPEEAAPVTVDPAAWESAVALPAIDLGSGSGSAELGGPSTRSPARAARAQAAPVRPAARAPLAPAEDEPGVSPVADRGSAGRPDETGAVDLSDVGHDADLSDHDPVDEELPSPQWTPLSKFGAPSSASPSSASGDDAGSGSVPRATPVETARRPLRDRLAERPPSPGSAESPEDDDEDDSADRPHLLATIVKVVILVVAAVIIGVIIGLLAFTGDQAGAMPAAEPRPAPTAPPSA